MCNIRILKKREKLKNEYVGLWRSWDARLNGIQEVRGSIPLRSTKMKVN